MVTLVPEKRAELTTEGGLDVAGHENHFREAVEPTQGGRNFRQSFCRSPGRADPGRRRGGRRLRRTPHRLLCRSQIPKPEAGKLFEELLAAAAHARQLGLKVKAGHGLDYRNIKRFRGRREFEEYSIGHSIISRAVLVGLEKAVREMIALINS